MSDSLDSRERDLFDSATTGDSSAPTDRALVNLPPSGTESDEDDEEDAMTAAEVLKQMNEIWLNENASPTLLPHRDEIVQLLLGCIRDMEENFANNRDNPDFQLIINVHQLEVHRLTYIINDYLRKRLEKIDTYPEQIMLEDKARIESGCNPNKVLLSAEERTYVNKRLLADKEMMDRVFLNKLPEALRTLHAPGQDLSVERVFLQVNSEPVSGIAMPDMKEPDSEYLIDLEPRSRHLLPFLSVRDALEENKIYVMRGKMELRELPDEYCAKIHKCFAYQKDVDEIIGRLENVVQQNPAVRSAGAIEAKRRQNPFELLAGSVKHFRVTLTNEENKESLVSIESMLRRLAIYDREVQVKSRRAMPNMRRYTSSEMSLLRKGQKRERTSKTVVDIENAACAVEMCNMQIGMLKKYSEKLPEYKAAHQQEVIEFFGILMKNYRKVTMDIIVTLEALGVHAFLEDPSTTK
ncbi:hypothetical protein QR680_018986 [Steinernema hermaphroditum]|uniref:GINS complex subunit 4 n=1 Tax=Steinernema hermaphroditum TaxID=289476 RepID=A0AA39HLT7_9BILA|nr:hypothetical protein QR680_018986 [Steinernema hermaphroditum]